MWELTESERHDGMTRWVLLHGGTERTIGKCKYHAPGRPKQPDEAAKFILMWPGLPRCHSITFRCVVNVAEGE